jgi:hypothetical protein
MGQSQTHSATRRTLAAVFSALLVLGPGATALAAPARTTVVALQYTPLPGTSDAFAARVFGQIAAELRQRSELKLVDVPSSSAGKSAAGKAKSEAERARAGSQDQLTKAGQAAQKNQPKQAALLLQQGITQLSAHPLALDEAGGKLFGDLLLQLAVTKAMSGDEEGADQTLAELVRRQPERTLAGGPFPPAFLRSFETERQRVLSQQRGSIRVFAPAGIANPRVLLDGRLLGNAPLMLSEVIPGDHAVLVDAGGEAWAETVRVDAGGQASLAPRLGAAAGDPTDPTGAALARGHLDRTTASQLVKLAKRAGAQAALVGTVSHEGDGYTVRSALILVKGEKVLPLASLSLDAELLGASLEVLRLADDVVAKLVAPGSSAPLPLTLGGSSNASAEATTEMPAVASAPPGADTGVGLPAAGDLAFATGTAKHDLPLPEPLPAPLDLPQAAPAAAPAPANPPSASRVVVPGSTPVPLSVSPPAPTAEVAQPQAQPAPARVVIVPGAAAASPVPAPHPSAVTTPPAPKPVPAAAGSLDAAMAGLSTEPAAPAQQAPATMPSDSSAERRVLVPGQSVPSPLPAPIAPPLAHEPAPANVEAPALATPAPKRVEAPAPSKDIFVPRRPTARDEPTEPEEAPIKMAVQANPQAPAVSTQMEAREANEVATVRENSPPKHGHAALWIVAGALVVGAAVVSGIVLYNSSQSATNSNVSLSWSH